MPKNAHFELKALKRDLEIGCDPSEYGILQQVVVSIRVALDDEQVFAGETATPPYDYCEMISAVDGAITSRPRFILQETLLVSIARRVLANPIVESVELRISKTQRYAGSDGLGVEATLDRTDLRRLAKRYPEESANAAEPRKPHD